MTELNDFMKQYDFKCKKCGAELTSESFIETVGLNGLIILSGESDGFIGWSCLRCNKPKINLIQLEKESLNQIVITYRRLLKKDNDFMGRFYYRSFPYRYDLLETDFLAHSCRILYCDFEAIHEDPFPSEKLQIEKSEVYCSYEFGTEAVGPALWVGWYTSSQIENLVARENETGLKLFPRYIIQNTVYPPIDNFCWKNRLHLEYLKTCNLPFEFTEFFIKTEKNRIKKAVEFLNFLEFLHSWELSPQSQKEFQNMISKSKDISGLRTPLETSPSQDSTLQDEMVGNHVWSAFHAEWMRKLLDNLAEDFISDYLSTTANIGCTMSSIDSLKDSYLKAISDAVSSRYKRDKIREKANANLRKRVVDAEKVFPNVKIVSDDVSIGEIKILISQMAPLKLADSFLILGERGTGKDLFARAIHEASKRNGQVIKIDCGAIPEKLFESELFGYRKGAFSGALQDTIGKFGYAMGGTLFFDEIGNLPLNLQPKLLRALQDRQYVPVGSGEVKKIDAKFIFATNKDLNKLVEEGSFMPDLYDRFKRPQFTIPPLRERNSDVLLLANYFIDSNDTHLQSNKDLQPIRLSKDCVEIFKAFDWPGNIRELQQVIKEIILMRQASGDRSEISETELPDDITQSNKKTPSYQSKGKKKLLGNTRITDDEIIHWMKELGNNKSHVAKQLGVVYKTIWERCKKLGL